MDAISIAEIREQFRAAQETTLPSLLEKYGTDQRAGVQALCRSAQGKLASLEKERRRVASMRAFERGAAGDYLTTGFLCGIDEAGRGPLAGPVAAGACILPPDHDLLYVNDSKKLTAQKREELYEAITGEAVSWAVALVDPAEIDRINILQATFEAMRQAVARLDPAPEVLVIDAVRIPGMHLPQVPVIKGDAKCLSVAAASILAKVTRDRLMLEEDRKYPEYGFAANKGYGSADHIAALKKYGPCPIHRRSFIGNFTGGGEGAPGTEDRRSVGSAWEIRAAGYLQSRGVRILEHSFRSRQGEIDLIGTDAEDTLLFIEVKYRKNDRYGTAAEAVTEEKQRTISEVSDFYRYIHHIGDGQRMRYDVVAIEDGDISWIRNAFPYRGRHAHGN
jgi:ribonuclease HII